MPGPAYHGRTHLPGGTDPIPDSGSSFSELVLAQTTHVVAYWKMDAASGSQTDYAANPLGDKPLSYHAGTNTGTYDVTGALTAGQDDGAFLFNYNQNITDGDQGGTQRGSYFNAGDSTNFRWAFPGTLPFSVECWVKPTAGSSQLVPAAVVGVSSESSGISNIQGWQLDWNAATIRIVRSNSSGVGGALTAALTAGVWSHVVATYDSTNMRLYVNGVLISTGPSATLLPSSPALSGVRVGLNKYAVGGNASYYYGAADEIALYDLALSATTVAAHYAAGVGTFSSIPSPSGAAAGDVLTADGAEATYWAPPTIEVTY